MVQVGSGMPSLPNSSKKMTVPRAYWKIIVRPMKHKTQIVGYELPQDTPRDANFCRYRTTLNFVENRSKMKLSPKIEGHILLQAAQLYSDMGC